MLKQFKRNTVIFVIYDYEGIRFLIYGLETAFLGTPGRNRVSKFVIINGRAC